MKGPYTKSGGGGSNPARTEWSRTWYRTSDGVKVRTPLPYRYSYAERVSPVYSLVSAYPVSLTRYLVQPGQNSVLEALRTRVHNKAYAKWIDKVKDGVQMGTNIAEYKQTLDMLRQAFTALRNPMAAFAKAASDPRRVIAGGYLAKHFGIDPLYEDIYKLLKMLEQQTQKQRVITAQARGTYTETISSNGQKQTRVYTVIVRHTAGVKVVDENLFSLNQLGVTNPIGLAWETIPFSFVVDWLYPVGLYLQQLDALLGLKLENPYTTTLCYLHQEVTSWYPVILNTDPGANKLQFAKGFYMDRSINTPAPVLQRTLNPWSTSYTRMATSLALVVQAATGRKV